jgi:hypothetical protein
MKFLLTLIFLLNSAFAFTPIKKGDPSPVDGYVVTKEQEKKLRQKVEDLEFKNVRLSDLSVKQDNMIKTQDRHIEIQKKHNSELRKELKERTGFWSKSVYFVLGCLTATAMGYVTVKALK